MIEWLTIIGILLIPIPVGIFFGWWLHRISRTYWAPKGRYITDRKKDR